MGTSTNEVVVREKLESVLDAYPTYAGFDTSVHLGELGKITSSSENGQRVSFKGDKGLMVIHRCPRGDITLVTSPSLGNVEGISRSCGRLQGIDHIPKDVAELLEALKMRGQNN